MAFGTRKRQVQRFFVNDRQNRLSFQRQLFTADRSRYVVNDFCSRQMKSKKSVNLITMKILDTRIYLKTSNRVLSEQARDKFKVFVHDGQNQLSFQRQLFTADRSRYFVNDFCSRMMKSKKSVNLITIKFLIHEYIFKQVIVFFLNKHETNLKFLYMMDRTS